MSKEKCRDCGHYRILSLHLIVDSKPHKSCDLGGHPDYCRIEFEKPHEEKKEYFFGGKN